MAEPLTEIKNIATTSMMEYINSNDMTTLRNDLMNNSKTEFCSKCYYEDAFNKVSGRLRQLKRSGLDNPETFTDKFYDSPHYDLFAYSKTNNGATKKYPIDLQIDLANTCNSACIMCDPISSSKLAIDYKKLNDISPKLFKIYPDTKNWISDPAVIAKFVTEISLLPDIEYIHFLGGETLYVDSFFTICDALIDSGAAKNLIMGTTTNGTIYSPRLEKIISSFKSVHLGISIDSVDALNDYVRYPSKINSVMVNLDKLLGLRKLNSELYIQLRITPNVFTIFYLDELMQYAIDHGVVVESCNILTDPPCLRIEIIPEHIRLLAIEKLSALLDRNNLVYVGKISNSRDRTIINSVTADAITSYIQLLKEMQPPENIEQLRTDLVEFVMAFEKIHHNCILDCAPEYTEFLTQYGYKRISP